MLWMRLFTFDLRVILKIQSTFSTAKCTHSQANDLLMVCTNTHAHKICIHWIGHRHVRSQHLYVWSFFLLQKNAEYYCYCCCRCIHCLSANGATATDAAAATTTTTQRMRVFTSMGAHKIGKYCNKSHRLCQPTLYSIVVPLHIRCGCLCADTNAIADCICARVCVCLCCSSVYMV